MYENYTTLPLLCYSTRDHRPPAEGLPVGTGAIEKKRNNVELIFVFKYKVDIAGGKLSNFVSAINWLKTLSKGLKKAKLISLTTEERH